MRRVLLSFGAIVTVIFAMIVFFLFTTAGLRLLFSLSPENLSAVIARGSINQGFVLEDVRYKGEGLILNIDQLELEWQLSGLLRQELIIQRIFIDDISLELLDGTSNAPAREPGISLPIGIRIDDFGVNNLTLIKQDSDQAQSIKTIAGRMHTDAQRLYIDSLSILADSYALDLEGHVDLAGMPAYRLSANWSYEVPDFTELAGQTSLAGDIMQTDFITTLSAPAEIELNIEVLDLLGDPGWRGTIAANQFDTSILTNSIAAHDIAISINGSGTLSSAVLQGDIKSATITAGSNRTSANSDAAYQIDNINLGFILDASFPTLDMLKLSASLDLQQGAMGAIDPLGTRLQLDSGQIQLDYNNKDYQLSVDTTFLLNNDIDGTLQASGRGDLDSIALDTFTLSLDQGVLTGEFSVLRSPDSISVTSTANWDRLLIPVNPDQTVELTDGNLSLTGKMDDYQLTVNSLIGVNGKGPLRLAMSATGDQGSLQINPLRLSLDRGVVNGRVGLQWADDLSANLVLDGVNINPGLFLEEWPGNLRFGAIVDARKSADDYEVTVEKLDVAGQLMEYPLALQLQSVIKKDGIVLSNASLSSGTSTALISGVWGLDKDINWIINAPDLSNLHKDLQGQLDAKGRFSGSLEQPQLSGTLHSIGVRTPWLDIESINSSFLINQSGNKEVDIQLDLTGLVREENIIDSLNIAAAGLLNQHQYDIQLNSSLADIKLNGEGTYIERIWKGQTQNLALLVNGHSWVNDAPFSLEINDSRVTLGRACVVEDVLSVCTEAVWDTANNWKAAITATDVPYDTINAYLPQGISTSGIASIKLDAGQTGLEPLRANATILSNTGSIRFQIDENNEQEFMLENLNGLISLENGTLDGRLTIQSANSQLPPLEASVSLSPVTISSMDIADLDIEARLNWMVNDLSFASNISPLVADVSGRLELDLSVNGRLLEPELSGSLLIDNVNMMIPRFGIEFNHFNLNGQRALDNTFKVTGNTISGEGNIAIDATLINEEGAQQINATIKGENFELVNTPEIHSYANTDLNVEINKENTILTGNIEIMNTHIDLNEIRETATISDDAVLVERPTVSRREKRTDVNVNIKFNENINIKGQGITGKFDGGIDIFSTDTGELLANGEIRIVDGQYSAYGQSLVIEEGRFIYNNYRLDNPELSIRAVKRINSDITAGLTVSGFLSSPQVTLISTTSLSDEDILSYIVFGRPISSLTSGEGTNLIGAATALGMRNSGFLTKSISSTFGLDTVELTSDNEGQNALVTIGKYITPKLYISYVYGLLESISTAIIRYDLTDSWFVEAKSGATSTGVDVFYSIEK